ncbi:hypothetical protein QBZ16_003801 [Prototheca wickerhamii]|uniref:PX domain-containing protein n=1 Tax=Prototheca wickerhamii TaxID=3111 RepID=A0AAD9IGN4_PROWI|nr:hypothetical protein QBZ16_003801 [Prototheca wickerhamii]
MGMFAEPGDPLAQSDYGLDMDDPPPYESIIMDAPAEAGPSGSGQEKLALEPSIVVEVTDPVRQLEGVRSFVSYRVTYRPVTGPGSADRPAGVIRRFSDFDWLKKQLRNAYKGKRRCDCRKNVVEKYKLTDDFVEQRRLALAVFVNRIACHPVLRDSPAFQTFLNADEGAFAAQVARSAAEGEAGVIAAAATGGPTAAVASAVSLLRSLGSKTSSLVSRQLGASAEPDPDAEYARLRVYFDRLERQVAEVHAQAARLARHQAALADAAAGFGEAAADLGAGPEGGAARELAALGERAAAAAAEGRAVAAALRREVEAPLREAARYLRSVQRATGQRDAAWAALCAARADAEARRARVGRLRATPGVPEGRVAEAERDQARGAARVEAEREAYEAIVKRLAEELAAFQRARRRSCAPRWRALQKSTRPAANARAGPGSARPPDLGGSAH